MPKKNELIEWWKKNENLFSSLALKIVGKDESYDVLQEVALAVLHKPPKSVNTEAEFIRWICTALKWRSIDSLRRHKLILLNDIESTYSDNKRKDDYEKAEHLLYIKQILWLIDNKLPDNQKIVLKKTINGRTNYEISREMGIKESTVRSILRHARLKLSKLLEIGIQNDVK